MIKDYKKINRYKNLKRKKNMELVYQEYLAIGAPLSLRALMRKAKVGQIKAKQFLMNKNKGNN